MITKIEVQNFKSLANFSLPLEMFTCLIGLNGAGKTTVLQVLDFIGHLACGKTDFRGWGKSELITNGSNSRTISFQIDFIVEKNKKYCWNGKYNIDKQRFSEEKIIDPASNCIEPKPYLQLKDNRLIYSGMMMPLVKKDISDYDYKGSVLSAFKFDDPVISAIKKELQSLKSMELLSPSSLRRSSLPGDELGIGGEGLSGYLSKLEEEEAKSLVAELHDFYPTVERYEIKSKQRGWRNLLLRETTLKFPVPASHINDGSLRILAMLSQKYSQAGFLLFDEIENGINQELVEKLLDVLQHFNGKQVLVTTHSALVLNYLTDEAAKASVVLLYKDNQGHTYAKRFFEIEKMKEKLEILGPGEVMSDTNLKDLSEKLALKVTAEGK